MAGRMPLAPGSDPDRRLESGAFPERRAALAGMTTSHTRPAADPTAERTAMADALIANPILNSPFLEPRRHFKFNDSGITNEVAEGRRTAIW